jgi:hypothetical protein
VADVIPFPTKAVRDWRDIEASIRATLQDIAMPPDGIDAVVARMKPFVELCSRDFSFSANYELKGPNAQSNAAMVNEVFAKLTDTFAKKLHLFTSELLFDRLKVEIELYWALA